MSESNERNLNVTINNTNDKDDEVAVSISSILKCFKKYLSVWLAVSIAVGFLGFAVSAVKTFVNKPPTKAFISFSYSGIEKGLDPAGRKFEITSMKNPNVIEKALTEMGLGLEKVEAIRANIRFDSKIPEDIYDRLTTYKRVMETATTGNLAAAEAMLDVTYNPTQFTVYFDYSEAGFDRTSGVEFLNTFLKCYGDYFYEQYGYNQPLGAAVNSIDYETYDYAQQIDLFRNSLRTVRRYLSSLANDDNTNFRSSVTGYTFIDLSENANTISSIDLDRISSYISVNNVTKDKESALAYYDYRIENLNRDKEEYAERLASIDASIEKYQKDSILIFGNGTDSTNTEYATHSEQYDALFKQKTSAEAQFAQIKQDIRFYESRREALKNNKNSSKANVERVEDDIAKLNEKVSKLVELTEQTANDYYENVQFANAYNILIPATKSVSAGIMDAVKNYLKLFIVLEAAIFAVYFIATLIAAIRVDGARKAARASGGRDDDDSDDEEPAKEAAPSETEKKPVKSGKKK